MAKSDKSERAYEIAKALEEHRKFAEKMKANFVKAKEMSIIGSTGTSLGYFTCLTCGQTYPSYQPHVCPVQQQQYSQYIAVTAKDFNDLVKVIEEIKNRLDQLEAILFEDDTDELGTAIVKEVAKSPEDEKKLEEAKSKVKLLEARLKAALGYDHP